MGEIILFNVLGIITGIVLSLIVKKVREISLFIPDPHGNPHVRYCKLCGQSHIKWFDGSFTWWETQGNTNDENCKCLNYAKYYG